MQRWRFVLHQATNEETILLNLFILQVDVRLKRTFLLDMVFEGIVGVNLRHVLAIRIVFDINIILIEL